MEAVVDRWLAVRRLTSRPITIHHLGLGLRCFLDWLAVAEPDISSFAQVTRDHVLGFLAAMAREPNPRTGRPLAAITRRARTSALSVFFRETAAMGWDGVPGRPLIDHGDHPRSPQRVPRFIPVDELARVMEAIARLDCPFQRAALLTARWSGARRSEIQRLALDCLERYPDGAARLRLPAGKTYRERVVPLHEDAAAAIQAVVDLRRNGIERTFVDDLTGLPVRYLFMGRGKLLSTHYLIEVPLRRACAAAGLVDADGRATVTAHRFRHTLGTQLAERGAKLHTIMRVLGHESPSMAMVYARISDPRGAARLPGRARPRRGHRRAWGRGGARRHARRDRGGLAEDQLPEDRAGAGPLPAPAGRGAVRVRPLPELRQVRDHPRLCPTPARETANRARARRGRAAPKLAKGDRAAPLHRRPARAPAG
jgi:integrase